MTDKLPMSDSHFKVMAFIHDNPLRRIFDNPIKTLKAAGIQPGQQVLEVGCGPGFFTIPAVKLVGDNGCIHAIDLHPLAIKMVEKKLQKNSLTNLKVTILPMRQRQDYPATVLTWSYFSVSFTPCHWSRFCQSFIEC